MFLYLIIRAEWHDYCGAVRAIASGTAQSKGSPRRKKKRKKIS